MYERGSWGVQHALAFLLEASHRCSCSLFTLQYALRRLGRGAYRLRVSGNAVNSRMRSYICFLPPLTLSYVSLWEAPRIFRFASLSLFFPLNVRPVEGCKADRFLIFKSRESDLTRPYLTFSRLSSSDFFHLQHTGVLSAGPMLTSTRLLYGPCFH